MIKQIVDGEVLHHQLLSEDIFQLDIYAPEVAEDVRAGQFVNVYLKDKSMLLPRPISICRREGKAVTLVYRIVGTGTALLAKYQKGDSIRISTGLGNGFYVDPVVEKSETIALVGGGLGVPPMLGLAEEIRGRMDASGKLIAILGFMEKPFLTERFGAFCDEVWIATDTGSAGFRGNVLDLIRERGISADYYLACGPKPMLRALTEYCGQKRVPLQLSLEERMGCGYGACVGCVCKTRPVESKPEKQEDPENDNGGIRLKKVCKDGPVFFGNEVVWDE